MSGKYTPPEVAPPPMPPYARSSVESPRQESLSSAKITQDSKGNPHPEVKIYEGTTTEEADRIAQLALDTFNTLVNRLGARANFS